MISNPSFCRTNRLGMPGAAIAAVMSIVPAIAGLVTNAAADGTNSLQLDEIVVTSQRREQSVQDIPYNISAITGDSLVKLNVSDIASLARNIGGLTYLDRGFRDNTVNNGLIIRGISASGVSQFVPNANQPTVSTYLGETPLFISLYLSDLERVEVLRGPQGTLFGAGSLGGTVRFIPNRPKTDGVYFRARGGISQTADSGGQNFRAEAIVNVPLSDSVAIRASAGRVIQHGFIDAPRLFRLEANGVPLLSNPADPFSRAELQSKRDVNYEELTFARVALRWQPRADQDFGFSYHRQTQSSGGIRADSPNAPDLRRNQAGIALEEPGKTVVDVFEATGEALIGIGRLSGSSSYYRNTINNISDTTGFYLGSFGGGLFDGVPRFVSRNEQPSRGEAYAQEVRLASVGDGKFDWIVGIYYLDQKFRTGTIETSPGISNIAPGRPEVIFRNGRSTSFKDVAAFGELTYQLTSQWKVTGGLRAFDQKFTSEQFSQFPFFGTIFANDGLDPLGGTYGARETNKNHDVLYKINTAYDLGTETLAYFTRSEGFRRGGTSSLPTSGVFAVDPSFLKYEPDRVTNWEIGIKGSMLKNAVQYTLAGFYIDWSNIQSFVTLPAGEAVVNAGAARSKGVELELRGNLSDRLIGAFSYTFIDAGLTKDFVLANGISGNAGNRLPGVPKHSFSASLQYEKPINQALSLSFQANTSYTDKTVGELDPNNTFAYLEYNSYMITNASFALNMRDWQITTYINNLANARAVSSALTPAGFLLDYSRAYVATPRTIGLDVTYKFGK